MKDFVSICKERAAAAMERFLHDLSYVPADKLTWSPAPTAKSALEIAAHCAGYSGLFASVIRAGKFPCSGEEFQTRAKSAMESVTTVDQAVTLLQKGMAETMDAFATVKPEQIGAMIDAPHAQVPFRFFLIIPALHLETHAGQIDYLQTCWGDLEVHL